MIGAELDLTLLRRQNDALTQRAEEAERRLRNAQRLSNSLQDQLMRVNRELLKTQDELRALKETHDNARSKVARALNADDEHSWGALLTMIDALGRRD